MRHPVRQRIGLAGSGTGDDQQWSCRVSVCQSNAMFHGLALLIVQFVQIGNCHAVIPDICLSVPADLHSDVYRSSIVFSNHHHACRQNRLQARLE